jgi:hypothetical protein
VFWYNSNVEAPRECGSMLLTMERVWAKIREFMGRIDALEDGHKQTKSDVDYLKKEVVILTKGQAHSDKIQNYLGQTVAQQQEEIKKLKKERGAAKGAATKAKNKAKRLEEELDRRH